MVPSHIKYYDRMLTPLARIIFVSASGRVLVNKTPSKSMSSREVDSEVLAENIVYVKREQVDTHTRYITYTP